MDPYRPINLQYTFKCQTKGVHYPAGVCIWNDRIVTTNYWSHKVNIFSQRGRLINSFGSKGDELGEFDSVYGICVVGDNLYVAEYGNKRIQAFDSDILPIGYISLSESNPQGICGTSKGRILITTGQDQIAVAHHGVILGAFGTTGKGKGEFMYPTGICTNSRGEVLIVDQGNHRIQVFDQRGEFLFAFGTQGTGSTQFSSPKGIRTDSDDNIFVTDGSNNRVCIFTSKGLPIQQIRFLEPIDLCLVKNRLIVTSAKGRVGVFSN